MPTSKKQLKANQQNAQKSTGPITESGKETSSQNATTYGLYSDRIIINSKYHTENRLDYELLVESLNHELQPETAFQQYLVRKIANCLWRTQRIALAETAHINKQINNLDYQIESNDLEPQSDEYQNLINQKTLPNKSYATNILYYEMRLDRQLSRTYTLLRKLQKKDEMQREESEKAKNGRNEPISS